MKIPPPPPTYNKDRTLTRRTVKGAAGGMKGVDYEDDRRASPSTQKATTGAGPNKDSPAVHAARHAPAEAALVRQAEQEPKPGKIREEDEMVLDDEDAMTRDKKAKENRRGFVPRDRLTIDKDAPKRLHKPKWSFEEEEDEEEPPEEEEIDLELVGEAITSAELEEVFDDRSRSRPGDPRLTDPADIQRRLGSPLGYAKHVMILAEAFRQATGASRQEAVDYLAAMFCAAPDHAFGRLALKAFGPPTGILDIYPLEVIECILSKYPAFLPKAGFGRLFADVPRGEHRALVLIAGEPTELRYPAGMKIRGFALRGGGRPGYRFEPAEDDDAYTLRIDAGGTYTVLVSGLLRSGYTVVDRIEVEVAGDLPLDDAVEIARDEEKIAAWPVPIPPPIDPRALVEERAARDDAGLLSPRELVHRQQIGALRGPKGEAIEAVDASADYPTFDEPLDELPPLETLVGPPTDEVELPEDLLEEPAGGVTIETDIPQELLDAPTFDTPSVEVVAPAEVEDTGDIESNASTAMRRIRDRTGGDPNENRLSVADRTLLGIAFATLADDGPEHAPDDAIWGTDTEAPHEPDDEPSEEARTPVERGATQFDLPAREPLPRDATRIDDDEPE